MHLESSSLFIKNLYQLSKLIVNKSRSWIAFPSILPRNCCGRLSFLATDIVCSVFCCTQLYSVIQCSAVSVVRAVQSFALHCTEVQAGAVLLRAEAPNGSRVKGRYWPLSYLSRDTISVTAQPSWHQVAQHYRHYVRHGRRTRWLNTMRIMCDMVGVPSGVTIGAQMFMQNSLLEFCCPAKHSRYSSVLPEPITLM